ncbi:hypothetical protein Hanom_Chr09g00854421 [Helianthus anomalus]
MDKSKIRRFNYHVPGHLARNCTKPPANRNSAPPQPAARNPERAVVPANTTVTASSGTPSNTVMVVQSDASFNWSTEIQHLNLTAPEN